MSEFKILPCGFRLLELKQVESTNLTALEYARKGDRGDLWVVAESQLNGKGSRGRSWTSVPGNLYASLLLRQTIPADKVSTLTFVVSLAMFHVLKNIAPDAEIDLKWPNDVLLNGKKVSGILLENHKPGGQEQAIIIGIGVNCQSSPHKTTYPATCLIDEGISQKPKEFLDLLIVEINKWIQIWNKGENFVEIRQAWLERANGLGREILVKSPTMELRGIFENLDENGFLILKMPNGQHHKISTADIFFSNHNKKGA
ncbi:MAG: biotin--[acetyl-CoA-carboxylase] ligase [Rhizobiaceae bacterium]|nr:biotin--[acetyl-CoA-carboxylase] ligase [Rhizobiaceae bacterium]